MHDNTNQEHSSALYVPIRRLAPVLGISLSTTYRMAESLHSVRVPGHRTVLVPLSRVRDVLGNDVADAVVGSRRQLLPDKLARLLHAGSIPGDEPATSDTISANVFAADGQGDGK